MAVVFTPAAEAAVVRPMTQVYDEVVYGDFIQIGNGNMRCPDPGDPPDPAATAVPIAACSPAQGRAVAANHVNDAFYMNWADVAEGPTFNSSTGSLALPPGATVEYARLNWAGDTGTFRLRNGNILARPACDVRERPGPGESVLPPGTPESTSVQLEVGAASTAVAPQTISRDPLATVGAGTAQYYAASADVTAQFADATTGEPLQVTVGNVWSPEGFGCFAGWSLTLVYAFDEPDPVFAPVARRVLVHDGHVRQEPSDVDAPTVVTVDGFTAIDDDARVGVTAFDGDFNIGGDTLSINGTPVPEPRPGGTTTNFFTSAADGAVDPAVANNLSADAKSFPTGLIPAGATTADFTFDTTDDDYLVTGLAVSVAASSISIEKTTVGDGPFRPGQPVPFEITVVKPGGGSATNVVVNDPLYGDCDRDLGTLAADVPVTYTCAGPAPETTGENSATVTALDEFGEPITDDDTSPIPVINSAIDITKTADQTSYEPGETITFTITVTNSGDSPLTGVTVDDAAVADCDNAIGPMAAGAIVTYTCTAIAPIPGDENVATVTGTDELGGVVTDSASADAPTVGAVDGRVFADRDDDGVFEPADGDTGIGGVTITLSGTTAGGDPVNQIVSTDADGLYVFVGIVAGSYTITETQPAAYDDGIDSPGGFAAPAGNDAFTLTMPSAGASEGNNFAELATSSVAGIVYEDANGDGGFDGGEPGLAGVTVTLTGVDEAANPVTLTTVTGATGNYSFDRLRPGLYALTETQPAGYLDGGDSVGGAGGVLLPPDSITAIALGSRVDAGGYDFGELRAAALSGLVVDGDGDGIAGVTITVVGFDGEGDVVNRVTTTDEFGVWLVADLSPGVYTITETQPIGYGDGPETVGAAGGELLPPDSITAIVLDSGEQGTGYVFAEAGGSIAGSVYEDVDNDGQFEPGEAPIAGVTVTLTGTDAAGDPVSRTTVTAGDGSYVFDDVLAGEYSIVETQPPDRLDGIDTPGSAGGVAVPPDTIVLTLAPGIDAVGYDFGELLTAGLTGSVVDDEGDPIGGVLITLTGVDDLGAPVDLTTTTNGEGSWSFLGLRPGSYAITETQPDGYGDGPETIGSAGGTSPVNDVFSVTLGSGVVGVGYVFAEDTGSLAGVVFEDSNGNGVRDEGEPGIGGVTVTLTPTDDDVSVLVSTLTAADGSYTFTGLLSGDYELTETQPGGFVDGVDTPGSAGGVSVEPDAIVDITLDESEDATGYTFAELRLAGISGTVVDDLGNPIEGVEIELTGVDGAGDPVTDTVFTESDGTWAFTDLPPGTYTVTEVQPEGYADGTDTAGPAGGTVTEPDSIANIALTSGGAAPGNQFVDVTASLAGVAFVDANGNGTQDDGEPGLQGVLVTLEGVDDLGDAVLETAVTDADGGYLFEGLLSGDYDVTETQPAGYDDGIDTVGTAGGELDGPDSIVDITLDEGEEATGYTFGEVLLAGISGRVVDEADNGIANVEITLTGTDGAGNTITDVTTTGTDGSWAFTELPPGTYTVTETQPEGYGDGPDTPGPAGGTATPPDSITGIVLTSGSSAPDNVFREMLGSIAGSVYVDANGNGVRDVGETGLQGVQVTLTGTDANGNEVIGLAVTAEDGSYLFDGLVAGLYAVTETQPNGIADGLDAVGSAGGVLAPPDAIVEIALDGAENGVGYTFGEILASSIAGTVVDEAGDGIADVEIDLTGTDGAGNPVFATVFTEPDGTWSFDGLSPGTYTVSEVQPEGYADGPETVGSAGGVLQPPDSITAIPLSSGTAATGYVFQENGGSLAGVVYEDRDGDGVQDPGEPGIAGVSVTLTRVDVPVANAVEAVTVTSDDGSYLFAGLVAGEYEVTAAQPGQYGDGVDTPGTAGGVPVPPDTIAEIQLEAGENATGYLFGETPSGVIGTVWVDTDADGVIDEEEELRVEGVTVIVRNAGGVEVGRDVTDVQGAYNVPNLVAGEYTVEELQPDGYGSTTPNVIEDLVIAQGSFAVANFGEELGEVGDYVWSDLDRDGIQDFGEPGLGGVTVILLDADGDELARTTSADDGSYAFVDVPLGTYRIGVQLPFGQSPTRPDQGVDSLDSDVDWVTYVSATFELTVDADGRSTRLDWMDVGVVAEQVDLTVDLTVDDTTPLVGDRVTFTAIVGNAGTTPAFGAEVTFTVPAGLDVTSAGGEDWTCFEVDAVTVRCTTWQVILPGESASRITMVATAVAAMSNAVVTATVSTVGEQVDVVPVNDSDSLTLTVTAGPGRPGPGLPGTGAAVKGLVALGMLLLVGGAATVLVTRRRRTTS